MMLRRARIGSLFLALVRDVRCAGQLRLVQSGEVAGEDCSKGRIGDDTLTNAPWETISRL